MSTVLARCTNIKGISTSFAALLFTFSGANSSAAVIGYTNQPSFTAAVGTVSVETFESFALGPVTTIPSLGIISMSGQNTSGNSTGQEIGSSLALPFPMFTSPLPSGTKFLSNLLASPTFASGGYIEFVFSSPMLAVGAFIADNTPVGNFSMGVFSGGASLGTITVAPRTLPDSFVGISSDIAFNRVRFISSNGESFGLDNLQVAAVPEPTILTLMFGGLLLVGVKTKQSRKAIPTKRSNVSK